MHFIALQAPAQRGINPLVALDQPLAFESTGHNGGVPMLAVAGKLNVLAVKTGADDGLEFFACHGFYGVFNKSQLSGGFCSRFSADALPPR